MSFLVYFAVIIFAAASALFGLDLLTAPLPDKPSPSIAGTQAPNKLAQREADKKEASAEQASKDDRALSPVLPTKPENGKDVRMVYPPTNETTGSAGASDKAVPPQQGTVQQAAAPPSPPAEQDVRPQQNATVQPQQPVRAQAEQPQTIAPPATSQNVEPSAATQSVTQQNAGRCDIAACAAAYASFRAVDCTYQPFSGPRRVCEKPANDTQRSTERMSPRAAEPRFDRGERDNRRNVQLRAVEERVRELTSWGRGALDEEDEDDAPLQSRRLIVIERGYGWR